MLAITLPDRIAQQADGHPTVAFYDDRASKQPVLTLGNGERMIVTVDDGSEWICVRLSGSHWAGRSGWLKKRNTKALPIEEPPTQSSDIPPPGDGQWVTTRIAQQADGHPTVAFYGDRAHKVPCSALSNGELVIVTADDGSEWLRVRISAGTSGWIKRRNAKAPPGADPCLQPAALPQSVVVSPESFQVMSLQQFTVWRSSQRRDVVHIKGFSNGMSSCYNEDALLQLAGAAILAWDGDPPAQDGFTALVPLFLQERGDRYAVAFKKADGVPKFQDNWRPYFAAFGARLLIVAIDPGDMGLVQAEMSRVASLPPRAQEFYALGRVAIRATKSQRVVALGGGGIAGHEAEASLQEGACWTVYALSRGSKEQFPSLMDWAARTRSPSLTFVCDRRDPTYANAFAGAAPAPPQASTRTAQQGDGHPTVAFYDDCASTLPALSLRNGEPLIVTSDGGGEWLGVRLSAESWAGRSGWVKRRNTTK